MNSQFGRSIGEIYYDHNAENIKESTVSEGQISYRRREIKLEKLFKCIGLSIMFLHTALDLGFRFTSNGENYPIVAFYVFEVIVLYHFFCKIYKITKKHHWFEHQRTIKQ